MSVRQTVRRHLPARHTVHYTALLTIGAAGIIAGLHSALGEGGGLAPVLWLTGGLVLAGASGYALARPEKAETDIGVFVWFSVAGAVLLGLGVGATILG